MRLPLSLEPKDLLVAALSVIGWVATAAYWTATTRATMQAQADTLATHTLVIATHTKELSDNTLWHATLSAHSDQDRSKFTDHEARLRAVEDRIAMIPVMANDVAWIKAYLAQEPHRTK